MFFGGIKEKHFFQIKNQLFTDYLLFVKRKTLESMSNLLKTTVVVMISFVMNLLRTLYRYAVQLPFNFKRCDLKTS